MYSNAIQINKIKQKASTYKGRYFKSLYFDQLTMTQIFRKIDTYDGDFTFRQHELLISVTHPNKAVVLFGRITDDAFPPKLKDIVDNIAELFELIKDIADDKLAVSANNELVLVMSMGKKSKEFPIPLQRAELSQEDSLKKRVEDLERKLQQKEFEATFFKEQFLFLLKNLTLKPNISELQKLYESGSVSELFLEKQELKESKLTSASSLKLNKVGSAPPSVQKQKQKQKQQLTCPSGHILKKTQTPHPFYKCNICRKGIAIYNDRLQCQPCDFDVCLQCTDIPPKSRKYCAKLHALLFSNAQNYEKRYCDKCKTPLKMTKGFSCISCNIDYCKKCI